jgi:hypothetical protein
MREQRIQLARIRHKPMRNPAAPRDHRSQAEKLEAAGQMILESIKELIL